MARADPSHPCEAARSALIIGGGGFLGQQATHYLAATGTEVHILDRAAAFSAEPTSTPHHYYAGSVTNPRDVDEAFAAAKPDCVIAMASYSHGGLGLLRAAEENPSGAVAVNVAGLVNVLDVTTRIRDTQLLWLSSTTVYGSADAYPGPVHEQSLLLPASVYGATKVLGEQLIRSYRTSHGLKASAVRPTLVWGPGLQYRGVQSSLNDMIAAAVNREPVAIADSNELWDLLYVRDAGRVLAWLVGRDPGPVILVNGYRASLRQVREAVLAEAPGTPIRPTEGATLIDLPAVDDTKIRRAGFKPGFDLPTSVADYLAHHRHT